MRSLLLFPFMLACAHTAPQSSPPVGAPSHAATVSAEDQAELPQIPSQQAVGGALRDVSPAAGQCGHGQPGVATAAVIFLPSGQVREVHITGVPPEVAECVAAVVRGVQIPPFRRPRFNVTFPFRVH